MEKYIVKVNDKKYKVEIPKTENINSIKTVMLNGKKLDIDVNMDTMCSIVVNNDTHKINGIYDYNGELVKLLMGKDYHSIEVVEDRPIKTSNKKSSDNIELDIISPMPGKIMHIDVKVGDKVEEGQDLITVEAMKMENKIKSSKKGTVKKVKVKAGDNCESGDSLMVIS